MMMGKDIRIPCFDSEIIVKPSREQEGAFAVSIQDTANPLAFGNELATFSTETQAEERARHFCAFYAKAREMGYYLKNHAFVKPDFEDIDVGVVFQEDLTEEQKEALLRE
ncbi:hypothetical protein [Paenibacillus sp. 1P07SE]|uniref:hypothetical protein n=1 Tax=Paenibacillus sp. 1P07SE TaxID=3132209 RepID=UPI0039A71C7E